MSPGSDWHEVMDGLTGRRLAVYDDLQHGKAVAEQAPVIENALGWLAYHRFIYRNAEGKLVTRSIKDARAQWEAQGANRDALKPQGETPRAAAQNLPERGGYTGPATIGVLGAVPGDKASPRPATEPEQPPVPHLPRPVQATLF